MCGRLDIRIDPSDALYLRARDLRLDRCSPWTMELVPTLQEGAFQAALWGIPRAQGGVHIHARREEGPTTWASAWYTRRAVIPVVGWWEGTWRVRGSGMYLAALTSRYPDGLRMVVVTKDGGPLADRFERLPIPLTADGAADWLGCRDISEQVSDFTIVSELTDGQRQASLFDG